MKKSQKSKKRKMFRFRKNRKRNKAKMESKQIKKMFQDVGCKQKTELETSKANKEKKTS